MRISPQEIILILVIFLLLFGAKKLPDAARSIGKAFKAFKREMKDMRSDLEVPENETNNKNDKQS
jgi:sec-independent protein translocase protein TatA